MSKTDNTIDHIILQHSHRGMDKLYALNNTPLCSPAAEAFISLMQKCSNKKNPREKRIFLYTGFYVNGYGETDGPLGAKFLYDAMVHLGFYPLIISDTSCTNYFPGMEQKLIRHGQDCNPQFRELLQTEQPIAHFSIERLSANEEGEYLNFSGKDISLFCPRLDQLFSMAKLPEFNAPTFAIGDGGNEIGMGNFAKLIKSYLHFSPAKTSCDYPILASVSNWGAYGFLAAVQKKLSVEACPRLLPTFSEVEEFLHHIVSYGATDGISGHNEMSIDGKDYRLDNDILTALHNFLS